MEWINHRTISIWKGIIWVFTLSELLQGHDFNSKCCRLSIFSVFPATLGSAGVYTQHIMMKRLMFHRIVHKCLLSFRPLWFLASPICQKWNIYHNYSPQPFIYTLTTPTPTHIRNYYHLLHVACQSKRYDQKFKILCENKHVIYNSNKWFSWTWVCFAFSCEFIYAFCCLNWM